MKRAQLYIIRFTKWILLALPIYATAQPISNYRWVDGESSRHEFFANFGQIANERYMLDQEHYFLNLGFNTQKLIYREPQGPRIILSTQPQINLLNTGLNSYRKYSNEKDITGHKLRLTPEEYKTRLSGLSFLRIPAIFLLEEQIDEWDLFAFGNANLNVLTRMYSSFYVKKRTIFKVNDDGFILQGEAGFGAGFRYNNLFKASFHYHHIWHSLTDDSKDYYLNHISTSTSPYYRYYDINASMKIHRVPGGELWLNLGHSRFVKSFDNSGFIKASIDYTHNFNWHTQTKEEKEADKSEMKNTSTEQSLKDVFDNLNHIEMAIKKFKSDMRKLDKRFDDILEQYRNLISIEWMAHEALQVDFYGSDDDACLDRLLTSKSELEELLLLSAKSRLSKPHKYKLSPRHNFAPFLKKTASHTLKVEELEALGEITCVRELLDFSVSPNCPVLDEIQKKLTPLTNDFSCNDLYHQSRFDQMIENLKKPGLASSVFDTDDDLLKNYYRNNRTDIGTEKLKEAQMRFANHFAEEIERLSEMAGRAGLSLPDINGCVDSVDVLRSKMTSLQAHNLIANYPTLTDKLNNVETKIIIYKIDILEPLIFNDMQNGYVDFSSNSTHTNIGQLNALSVSNNETVKERVIKGKAELMILALPVYNTGESLDLVNNARDVKTITQALGLLDTAFNGPLNEEKIKAFQKDNGLGADGVFGKNSVAKLNKLLQGLVNSN